MTPSGLWAVAALAITPLQVDDLQVGPEPMPLPGYERFSKRQLWLGAERFRSKTRVLEAKVAALQAARARQAERSDDLNADLAKCFNLAKEAQQEADASVSQGMTYFVATLTFIFGAGLALGAAAAFQGVDSSR